MVKIKKKLNTAALLYLDYHIFYGELFSVSSSSQRKEEIAQHGEIYPDREWLLQQLLLLIFMIVPPLISVVRITTVFTVFIKFQSDSQI